MLDIGCGSGQTSCDVARIAAVGHVFGIDLAKPALQAAQLRKSATGLHNVDFVSGDAAQLPFVRASFDIVISRFGTMFFANPAEAFINIRETLRPGGRLVMMVWQSAQQNEWAVAIHRALVGDNSSLPKSQPGPSAFSLGDEQTLRNVLYAAAFVDVRLKEVHAPVYYGPNEEIAFQFVSEFATVTCVLKLQTHPERTRTLARLRDTMARHSTREGVLFDSRAWIVSARCE